MTVLVARLQPYVAASKKDTGYRAKTLIAIEKHWGRALYERFYQIDEVLGSDKFFRRVETVVRRYRGARMVIAIRAINNLIAHRLLNARVGIPSDSYCYQTTNNFEKLIGQEGAEITSPITTPILLAIRMHIGPTRFLEDGAPKVEFDTDGTIRERLVVV